MAAGRYAEACESFAESNRIDPATGGTVLNLAVCHEKLGRFATAAAEFEQARALARHYSRPDREQFAEQHAAALRTRVSTLSFAVREPAAGEAILLDGVAVAKVAWSGLPIDPGAHTVSASAPGKLPWSTTVHIGTERESRTVDVDALADAPVPLGPAAVISPPLDVEPGPSRAARGETTRTPTQRIVGFSLGGVGLAAVAVGAAFGVAAIEENSTSLQNCPGGRCTQTGADDSRYAMADANVANVCIVAGVVAVGVATVLVLTSGSRGLPGKTTGIAQVLGASLAAGTPGLGGEF